MNRSLMSFALFALLGAGPLPYTGVNLCGGEFGPASRPGVRRTFGKDYTFPTAAEVDGIARRGMNVIRLPFRWESLQPTLGQPLDPAELRRLTTIVHAVTARRCVAVIDPHNFARYYGKVIGGPDVAAADFADLWRRLAPTFAADDRVWFNLMNEPHDMPPAQWLTAANGAIAAVRSAGAKNMILVPGTAWTGAHSWITSGNADVMLGVVDPADRWAYDVHQYLDRDSSGTKPDVVSPTIGSQRLTAFTDWCRAHHRKAFLGEFAAAADVPTGRAAIDDMLAHTEASPDVWIGWCWWAAGPWWHDYMFSVEPNADGTDRPQLAWLRPHLRGTAAAPAGR